MNGGITSDENTNRIKAAFNQMAYGALEEDDIIV